MTTIVTRVLGGSPKGSPLTNAEVDTNFINLNTDKQENLVSGTTIKTINGSSILGAGDLVLSTGKNTDGGAPDTIYMISQNIDGGTP